MRSVLLVAIAIFFSTSARAAEYREVTITAINDLSVVGSPKGCEQSRGRLRGKKKVDCYAVLLRGVEGTNKLGKTEKVGEVILFPAGLDRSSVDNIATLMIRYLKQDLSDSVTVQFSSLRYLDKEIPLSVITKDSNDSSNVKMGGMTLFLKTVEQDGIYTRTESETINMGLR